MLLFYYKNAKNKIARVKWLTGQRKGRGFPRQEKGLQLGTTTDYGEYEKPEYLMQIKEGTAGELRWTLLKNEWWEWRHSVSCKHLMSSDKISQNKIEFD